MKEVNQIKLKHRNGKFIVAVLCLFYFTLCKLFR